MKLVCKIACLALLMNTLPGIGQERVFYKTVQLNGLNIFYREAGPANGLVILLLHGFPTSSRMYQALLESPLSAKYRLIARTTRASATLHGRARKNSATRSTI